MFSSSRSRLLTACSSVQDVCQINAAWKAARAGPLGWGCLTARGPLNCCARTWRPGSPVRTALSGRRKYSCPPVVFRSQFLSLSLCVCLGTYRRGKLMLPAVTLKLAYVTTPAVTMMMMMLDRVSGVSRRKGAPPSACVSRVAPPPPSLRPNWLSTAPSHGGPSPRRVCFTSSE